MLSLFHVSVNLQAARTPSSANPVPHEGPIPEVRHFGKNSLVMCRLRATGRPFRPRLLDGSRRLAAISDPRRYSQAGTFLTTPISHLQLSLGGAPSRGTTPSRPNGCCRGTLRICGTVLQ